MFDNAYLEKIAKIVGLQGELLPNKAEVMDKALRKDMAEQIYPTNIRATTGIPRDSGGGSSSYRNTFTPPAEPNVRNDAKRYERWLKYNAANNPERAAVQATVQNAVKKDVAAKAQSKGMGMAAKLGLGGLAAAGLAGGAYALHAANDGHHKKRASAIEGLMLAGYSVDQALQLLEG